MWVFLFMRQLSFKGKYLHGMCDSACVVMGRAIFARVEHRALFDWAVESRQYEKMTKQSRLICIYAGLSG